MRLPARTPQSAQVPFRAFLQRTTVYLVSCGVTKPSYVCRGQSADEDQASWGCPKCRTAYLPSEVPSEYRCFCGKQKDPPLDPWLAPHTCGDICGKGLASDCGHTCVLLCHPGPCPPCPRQVRPCLTKPEPQKQACLL